MLITTKSFIKWIPEFHQANNEGIVYVTTCYLSYELIFLLKDKILSGCGNMSWQCKKLPSADYYLYPGRSGMFKGFYSCFNQFSNLFLMSFQQLSKICTFVSKFQFVCTEIFKKSLKVFLNSLIGFFIYCLRFH